jgi:hypothetical protein
VRSSSRECLRSVMRSMPITRAKTMRTAKKAVPHVRWQHRRPCSVIVCGQAEKPYPQVKRYRRSQAYCIDLGQKVSARYRLRVHVGRPP